MTFDRRTFIKTGAALSAAALGAPAIAQQRAKVKLGYLHPEYRDAAAAAFMVLSPGAVNQDIPALPYERVQRPIYPLDPDMPDPDLTPRIFEPIG